MAQVCGGTTYDFVWAQKLEVVLKHLRHSADAYAADRVKDIPLSIMVGAILYPLMTPPGRWEPILTAPFSDWKSLQITTVKVLETIRPKAPQTLINSTAESLEYTCQVATNKWNSTGYPEEPATLEVLNQFVEILFRSKFTKHPPNENKSRTSS